MNRKLAKILKNLDEQKKVMLLAIIESPIKWDLVSFFQNNPFSIHTARGLANMVGRLADQVYVEAEELASFSILKKICENGEMSSIYAYEPPQEIASLLLSLVEIYNEDHALLEELHRILREDASK